MPPARRSAPLGDPDASPRTVQNLLFVLGAVLLGIAAIVFTVVAWTSYGVGGRAAILGGATLIAFAIPVVAVRRRLTATAETFTAIALLLLILDGYGLWALDVGGAADSLAGTTFAGGVAAVVAAVAAGFGRAPAADRPAVRGDHRGAACVAARAREPSDIGQRGRDLFRRSRLGRHHRHCLAPSRRPAGSERGGPNTSSRGSSRSWRWRSRPPSPGAAWSSAIHIGSVLGAAAAVAVVAVVLAWTGWFARPEYLRVAAVAAAVIEFGVAMFRVGIVATPLYPLIVAAIVTLAIAASSRAVPRALVAVPGRDDRRVHRDGCSRRGHAGAARRECADPGDRAERVVARRSQRACRNR